MTTAATVAGPLEVSNVWVKAGSFTILHGVGFRLYPGEMCGIIGPSGAGKSTLIKVLLDVKRPDTGGATLSGLPVGKTGPVGYVPQDDALHRSLTVRAALDFAAQLRLVGWSEQARVDRVNEVCRQVGLDERLGLRIKKLSGGQRKRVSVALELLTQPTLLILDEPTSGLDPGLEARMMGLFAQVARSGRTVLVSTHAMQSLNKCDALMVLVQGHLAYFGAPKKAPDYFKAHDFVNIFERLPLRKPAAWKKVWQESSLRQEFAARPRPAFAPIGAAARPPAPPPAPSESAPGPAKSPPPAPPPKPSPPAAPSAEQQLAELKARMGKGGPQ